MSRARILILDDETGVCDMLSRLFRYRGWEPDANTRPEAALSALQNGDRYSVALVDLVLAAGNGLDFIREMRRVDPELRFLVLSGKLVTEGDIAEMEGMGVRYHAKPFRNAELLREVESLLP